MPQRYLFLFYVKYADSDKNEISFQKLHSLIGTSNFQMKSPCLDLMLHVHWEIRESEAHRFEIPTPAGLNPGRVKLMTLELILVAS